MFGDHGEAIVLQDYADFNASLLMFLPKKSSGVTDVGLEIYNCGDVRPLNITNCDNRLLASAVRVAIEPTLSALITGDQRGFIGGRSMIANLIDIDEAMALESLHSADSVCLFYDFAAAFPSVEHTLLMEYFKALGWPSWLLRFIGVLYANNHCFISMGGSLFLGFLLSHGIRQGCPLSPLLFSASSELILRRIAKLVPEALVRAWADDIAMVVRGGMHRLGHIQHICMSSQNFQG